MVIEDVMSNMTGRVIKYEAVNASQNVGSYAGGDEDDFYSNFCLGNKACQKRKAAKQESKNKAREVKAGAKATKAEAKVQEAEAKKMSADAAKEGVKGDVALADAIAKSAPVEAIKGLSTPAKIGIGVGIFLLIGGIAFALHLKSKKK